MVGVESDVGGVRIIPPLVEFVDAVINERYALTFTIQNVSKFSRKIRFHPPVTDKFKLLVKNPNQPVAPGLEINAVVEYENDKPEDARDRILLAVDDDVVEIPLYAYMPTPLLDIEGPVDFGLIVANSRVISKEVALINHGSIKGSFSIKYDGIFPIVITPMSGEVDPKTIQLIKVDLATEKPFTMNETASVELEGMKDTELEIKGRVVEQYLQLLQPDTKTEFKRVEFGPAFYGTDRVEHAYLYNNGPEPVKWVSVLEEGVDGEEAGTDLTKSTLAMLATSPLERIRGRAYDVLTSLVSVFPNQGTINPYQKIPICFRFSPRFISSSIGWEATEKPPPRQDFALFMTFSMVGSSDTYEDDKERAKKVEVAVTGTAVPVLVNIQPSNAYDFGEINCGDGTSTLCTLSNESALLPISIKSRKVAHFNVIPVNAKIGPGKSQDILISFQPNQAGTFKSLQIFDVLGKICDGSKGSPKESFTKLSKKSFQTLPLQLIGRAIAPSKPPVPKINPGITPMIRNEVGLSSDLPYNELNKIRGQIKPDIFNSTDTSVHSHQKRMRSFENSKALVAFPNDRPASVRPSKRGDDYQTPFTRTKRHHYVDPDYGYTLEEDQLRSEHRNKYKEFIREQAQRRRSSEKTKDFKKIDNDVDLGMKPSSGLLPPKLLLSEMDTEAAYQESPIKEKHRLLTTRQLMTQQQQTLNRPVSEGLNAVPTTGREKTDCRRVLSPQDLHKITIGPPTIDYGMVCLRSTNQKQLHVVNNLDHYIHVQMVINCKELRQTSPLSQVVPARSKAQFTLVFESNAEGKFQRSISYSVNSQHESHVLILADVVPVCLELSHTSLELLPERGLPVEAGFRSTVTVHNRRNFPAEFTWSPVLSDRGTAFSIRPATGIVDAYKDLKCEVVFHPSYFAPLEGEFHMQVHNGNSMKLKSTAKLGPVNVKFTERRVLFGNVPLNMQTTRKAVLQNVGQNHAMFYVINSTPFPGMTVTPTHGIIPVGGHAEFKIVLNPTAVVKFDTWIQVNIRGWRTIEVRLGGTVEPPEVDIDVKAFKFHGIYCHSTAKIPFNFINLSSTRVCAEIDLTKYADFSLTFPDLLENDPEKAEKVSPHRYEITLRGGQSLPCLLNFDPTAIASYDFTLPVVVNKTGAPSPAPSTFPPTPVPSEHPIVTPRQIVISIPTPRRRVQATALKPILQLSTSEFEFYLPPTVMSMHLSDNAKGDQKDLVFTNRSDQAVEWELGIQKIKGFLDNCSFSFMKPGGAWFNLEKVGGIIAPHERYTLSIYFNPTKTGSFVYNVPLYIQKDKSVPYRQITMKCNIEAPKIVFDPLALVLTPVPLATAVYAEFNLVATGYLKETALSYNIPDVEADDGSKMKCFDLEFPDRALISAPKSNASNDKIQVVVPCILTFRSEKPISVTSDITIVDADGRKYVIPVTATADNCLLTVYPFLAAHRNDHQIVCEQDKSLRGPQYEANSASLGEAVLLPCVSPLRPSTRGSTSVTSSHFDASSSSYAESTNSVSESDFIPASRDGAAQPIMHENSDVTSASKRRIMSRQQGNKNALAGQRAVSVDEKELEDVLTRRELISRSLGSAVFPFESTLESHFHHEVLNSVQRWFSSHGWSGGPFPITVPHSLRGLFTRNFNDDGDFAKPKQGNQAGGSRTALKATFTQSGLKKDAKTVYDMLYHLCGRAVPGISQNQQLPFDRTERVTQLHWQHSTLLSFLRGQGASVAAIRPEFLFTPSDYLHWVKVRQKTEKKGEEKDKDEEETEESKQQVLSNLQIEEELFESVSKRAWTDVMLQIYKVLVLSRINPTQYAGMKPVWKESPLPKVNPAPYVSNVYSVGERIVLAWLNYNYTHQRKLIWGDACEMADKVKGGLPPSRWVVNFDYDLLDGLVLASAMAAYCPWLITDYFVNMYTAPSSPEQCLHNTLILVKAMRSVGIDYDIQATDITDPNPITLLMLCVYLYQNLPQYLIKTKVHFVGPFQTEVLKQIRLSNSSSKPLKYLARISGRDGRDFKLPKGDEIIVPSKSSTKLDVVFKSRFLRPTEAILVLIGIRTSYDVTQLPGTVGSTMVFQLTTAVSNVAPVTTIRSEAPCYEMQKIAVPLVNPFSESASFRVVLFESGDSLPSPLDIGSKQIGDRSSSKTLSSRIKSVRSRTDHGQTKDPSPPPSPPPDLRYVPDTKESSKAPRPTMTPQLTSFFCHSQEIFLESQQTTNLNLEFLPFNAGKKHCSVLLMHEKVGEFLYGVEGVSTQPFPSILTSNPISKNSVRISSAVAPVRGKKSSAEDVVAHFKCENNQTLNDSLMIPITNGLKEQALRIAAKQRMSEKEKQRRKLTGTLDSGSVTAFIASMGMLENQGDGDRELNSTFPASVPPPPRSIKFSVQATCPWFKFPKTFTIPSPLTFGPKLASDMIRDKSGPNDQQDDGYIALPFQFDPNGPGHYPCEVVLSSPGDIRVYKLDCTVNPSGTTARLEFSTPAHQSVTQNIPLQNASNHDWELDCVIKGDGFYGPSHMIAKAGQTAYYPLMFKPHFECTVTGQLVIKNKTGTQHVFNLSGIGESPMALDHIVIPCKCRQTTSYTVNVPNYAPYKLAYKVITDIPCLDGGNLVSVMKGQSSKYTFTVSPWQRGKCSGILAFVVDDIEKAQELFKEDSDDSDEKPDHEEEKDDASRPAMSLSLDKETPAYLKPQKRSDSRLNSFRVWYSVNLEVEPSDPMGTIEVDCPVLSSRDIEIPIKNPTGERVEFDVVIDSDVLHGESKLLLAPRIPANYNLTFAPSLIGDHDASVIFNSPQTGEFWYKLVLHSVSPPPKQLPHMDCQLGRWSRQYIELYNPSDEVMEVEADLNNPVNFSLDVPVFSSGDPENSALSFQVQPKSSMNVPVQFVPSTLGAANHQAKLTLISKQLGRTTYLLAGRGVAPKPMEPVSVSAAVGSSTSLILPFRNPTDVPVLVDITLTDFEKTLNSIADSVIRNNITAESAFCLLLKHTHSIRLEGKQSFDIPFTFSPDTMRRFDGSLAIAIRREDGQYWPDETDGLGDYSDWLSNNSTSLSPSSLRKTADGQIKYIRYVFPVHGIPEVRATHTTEAVLKCQARSRIEERLEVTLTGAMPSVSSAHELTRLRAVSPLDARPRSQSDGVIIEGHSVAEEFTFELDYPENEDTKQHLEQSLGVSLVRKERNPHTGMVVLVFNLVFSPFRQLKERVILNVKSATGGVWSFPISVRASEPPPDDVIRIEAAGLNKGSTVSFTMYSQSNRATPFQAYFVHGGDQEFSIDPSSGELLPQGTSGTRISVTFTPKIYGRSYNARLVIQTLDMQWAYDIKGVSPGYKPPTGKSVISSSARFTRVAQRPRVNFIRENLKLTATAVSSPIKGMPLCTHIKTN